MTLEQRMYEAHWGYCHRCKGRRPSSELRPDQVLLRGANAFKAVKVCKDAAVCDVLKAARR